MKYTLLPMAIAVSQFVYGQHADSLEAAKSHRFARAIALPVTLVAAGFAIRQKDQAIHNYLGRSDAEDELTPKTSMKISDYTQFAPIALVYGMSLMNNKGEHKALKSASMLLQSEIMMVAIVRPVKTLTHETRPDGGSHSFPSGHTAQAFLAATFLHKEYGHKSIWYSVAGYTMATAVGACRMMGNRHWASDVLVGAGIGVLSTNLIYLYHKHRNKNGIKITALPSYNRGPGFYVSVKI